MLLFLNCISRETYLDSIDAYYSLPYACECRQPYTLRILIVDINHN